MWRGEQPNSSEYRRSLVSRHGLAYQTQQRSTDVHEGAAASFLIFLLHCSKSDPYKV